MFALLVLAAADFLVVLDGLIVSVALPSIQRDLGFSQAGLQWVVNGDLLAFGGVLVCWVDVPPTWWGGGGCSSPGWWCSLSGRWRVAWPHRRGCWWPLGLARGSERR
jgi:MFS family permease